MRRVAVAAIALLVLAAPAAGEEPLTYEPPVDSPVRDPFRPPSTPYGPGNRGLEYATARGAPVHAAAPGTVTFAGQVGGRRYVTVQHADGIRTTYGPLGRMTVRRGDTLAAGDVVGASAGAQLLWTARLGDVYVDPAVLLAASGTGRVRLVADRTRWGAPGSPRYARPPARRPPSRATTPPSSPADPRSRAR